MAKRLFNRRLLAATLCFVFGALLALGFSGTSAAISFSALGNFSNDVGIDYSQLTGNLVTSFNFGNTGAASLANVDRFTGVHTPIPGLNNFSDELKVATVRQVVGACSQQWPVGTIFTGNGHPGQIVKIDPNGTVTSPWVTLPGENSVLRGGFFHDRFCVSGGDLIVVSGSGTQPTNSLNDGGKVWRVNAAGTPSLVTPQILAAPGRTAHLEGVITVPNDPKYGPWAGKIVTGDEDRVFQTTSPGSPSNPLVTHGTNPKIYAIDPTSGSVLTSTTGSPTPGVTFQMTVVNGPAGLPGNLPHPEDFDFIDGDFYGVAFNVNGAPNGGGGQGHILTAPFGSFAAGDGDILITQEYPHNQLELGLLVDVGSDSGLFQVKWDGTKFVATQLLRTGAPTPFLAQWEHVTFVPASDVSIVKTPDGNSFNIGDNINFTMVVTSTGPGTATNVKLTDPLPTPGNLTSWQVDSVTPTGLITPAPTNASCTITSGNQLSCNFGSMAAGATVTVKVSTNTAGGANSAACTANNGRVDNTATVTAAPTISKSDTGFWTCKPPPTNLQTVTQGGWGAPAHGNNPGTILNAYFASHPGAQFVIGSNSGGCFKDTFTSAAAIRAFLPQGGTPSALTASATNSTAKTNVFAGQVLALQLNVTLSNAGNLPGGLGSFVLTSGPAAGKTVNQVLADANKALGGCGLPSYVSTISDLNDIVDSINEKFDKD